MYMKAIATPPGEPTQYVEMTPDEIEAFLALQSEPPPPVPLIERLSTIFEAASAGVQSVPLRAYFRTLQVAVSFCLSNQVNPDVEAAKYYIETATMPDGSPLTEDLIPLQAALLAEFEA